MNLKKKSPRDSFENLHGANVNSKGKNLNVTQLSIYRFIFQSCQVAAQPVVIMNYTLINRNMIPVIILKKGKKKSQKLSPSRI